MSHLAILEKAQRDNIQKLLILEDDLYFSNQFQTKEAEIIEYLKKNPWGMIYLGHCISSDELSSELVQEYSDSLKCSHFVGFHRSAIDLLVPYLKAILQRAPGDPDGGPMHVDGAYNRFRHDHQIITLVVNSSLGMQRPSRSDVAPLKWYDKVHFLRWLVYASRRIKQLITNKI